MEVAQDWMGVEGSVIPTYWELRKEVSFVALYFPPGGTALNCEKTQALCWPAECATRGSMPPMACR